MTNQTKMTSNSRLETNRINTWEELNRKAPSPLISWSTSKLTAWTTTRSNHSRQPRFQQRGHFPISIFYFPLSAFLRSPPDPPQNPSHNPPVSVAPHRNRFVVPVLRFQQLHAFHRQETRQSQSGPLVPGHDDLAIQIVCVVLAAIHHHDVAVIDHRTHRSPAHPQATGRCRVRAPQRRSRDH